MSYPIKLIRSPLNIWIEKFTLISGYIWKVFCPRSSTTATLISPFDYYLNCMNKNQYMHDYVHCTYSIKHVQLRKRSFLFQSKCQSFYKRKISLTKCPYVIVGLSLVLLKRWFIENKTSTRLHMYWYYTI